MRSISRRFGADFDMVVDFLEDSRRVRSGRLVILPAVIGGHYILPNAELLLKRFDASFDL